ncbi:Citrate lyase subunit beta-like protein [Blattella germanica]|nr:Citrate lyase subunit beta-like protein [Blattella germanica]
MGSNMLLKSIPKLFTMQQFCTRHVCKPPSRTLIRHFTARRAILYVPGDQQKKLDKSINLDVDCLAMDCEDGVAVNRKSGLCEQDLEAVLSAKTLPPTVLLPKVERTGDIEWFSEKIIELLTPRGLEAKLNLIIYIESALAMMDLPEICTAAKDLSVSAPFTPAALVIGSDDLCASLDLVGLKEQCEMGKKMGFTGKQVIHPCQIPVVQETFLPSKEAISWAQGLVQAFHEHQQRGEGVFVYKGSMIDRPSLRQAQNILQLASAAQSKKTQETTRFEKSVCKMITSQFFMPAIIKPITLQYLWRKLTPISENCNFGFREDVQTFN